MWDPSKILIILTPTLNIAPLPIPAEPLLEQYGRGARLCSCANDKITLVFSQEYTFDLVELEQLLEAVGWSRRPIRRVRKALTHSLLKVGLWRHLLTDDLMILGPSNFLIR